MQITCPACNAAYSLEAALALDAGRAALLAALRMPAPLAMLLAQYLGLFRSKGRKLSFDRTDRLLTELQPFFDREIVTRNGVTRQCPLALWQQALERMLEQRNADKLTLPLKTHGYLLEIAFGLADSVDAKAERAVEESRRRGDAREEGDRRMQRIEATYRITSDLKLGLIGAHEAERRLREVGISNDEAVRILRDLKTAQGDAP